MNKFILFLLLVPLLASAQEGKRLFEAAGCVNCHTEKSSKELLAGGRALTTPFGVFYSPNITNHPTEGIGRWTDQDFIKALRHGISPQNEYYYPAFPFRAYTQMSERDMLLIKNYIATLPVSDRKNRPHELSPLVRPRNFLFGWRALYFTPGQVRNQTRGEYLVEAVTHCAECHTPRNPITGGLLSNWWMAGTKNGPEGKPVPNITSDKETGVGSWSKDDWASFFEDGITPSGDMVGGEMAVVLKGVAKLPAEDREAMIEYLRSLPAKKHKVR